MRFTIKGEFPAESIDEAFALLAAHFSALSDEIDVDVFEGSPHTFEVKPKEEK